MVEPKNYRIKSFVRERDFLANNFKNSYGYYLLDNTGTYDLCELRVRTVMDNWFCGVDKKDKRAYLISFNEIDENVFEDRKIALKRIHNAEQKYPQVSGETYYEEY